ISRFQDDRHSPKNGEIRWEWYQDMGYYKGFPQNRIDAFDDFRVDRINKQVTVLGPRVVRNTHQYITLACMQAAAAEFGSITFDESQEYKQERLQQFEADKAKDPILNTYANYVLKYVTDNYFVNGIDYAVDINRALKGDKAACQHIYHTYIHNSLNPTDWLANGGDFATNRDPATGLPRRTLVDGG
ncbi:MAG: hypothetical protein ACRCWR_07175, partial [Saezia sp.]